MAGRVGKREKDQRSALRRAVRKYIPIIEDARKKDMNEADTRLRLSKFFEDVLGYDLFTDMSREHTVRKTFVDFAIRVDDKIKFFVEVKPVGVALGEHHLRQVVGYAVNAGVEWCLLTNSVEFSMYRVVFGKPIERELVLSANIIEDDISDVCDVLWYLTKASIKKGEIDDYWDRICCLSPENVTVALFKPPVVRAFRRELKELTGRGVGEDDAIEALRRVIEKSVSMESSVLTSMKRKHKRAARAKKERTISKGTTHEDLTVEAGEGAQPEVDEEGSTGTTAQRGI
jgi:hypothetical protein